jgi:2-C-methyl-D-erythritol 4-phosphate cytidylyltransferase
VKCPTTSIILAAAGEGRRLGSRLPKALVPLGGRPLFLHSVRTFSRLSFVREIILVLPGDRMAQVQEVYAKELRRGRVTRLVEGGARRQDSVRLGLLAATSPIVLVHDAARPLVSPEAVRDVVLAAARHGAAVLAAPAVDTIKIADRQGRVRETPDRSRVWLAQTPQGFRRQVLLTAYRWNGTKDVTDDVQLVERAGKKVVIVPSLRPNFKVTTREDLVRAEQFLKRRKSR